VIAGAEVPPFAAAVRRRQQLRHRSRPAPPVVPRSSTWEGFWSDRQAVYLKLITLAALFLAAGFLEGPW
jgi:hypothetical protein